MTAQQAPEPHANLQRVEESSGRPLRLAIIVLHYGDVAQTQACVRSLLYQRSSSWQARFLLVDNSATDALASVDFPEGCEVVATGTNLGYGGGMNAGIAHALRGEADYFLLLNNDVCLAPEALSAFAEVVTRHPEAGVYGGKIYYKSPAERVWFAGGRVHFWLGRTTHRGYRRKDRPRWNGLETTGFITGAMMLVAREVFEKIGLFDDSLFLYFEDVDFCLRARRAGFRPVYCGEAQARHAVGAEKNGSLSARYLYYQTRNRWYVFAAPRGRAYRAYFLLLDICLYTGLRALLLLIRRRFNAFRPAAAVLRGFVDSLRGIRGEAEMAP